MAEAPAPRGFDDWACQNRDDRIREVSALRVAMGDAAVRLVEQAGGGNYYGLIEIIMDNMIATGNSRGTAHKEFFVRVDDVTGVNVFEKFNHGVVDLEFLGPEGAVMAPRSFPDRRHDRIHQLRTHPGMGFAGLRVREQDHYGIVDVKLICEWR